jgi:superfamily II DNA helicase RecQ
MHQNHQHSAPANQVLLLQARLVIDECHIPFTQGWRNLQDIVKLREMKFPYLLITATSPPTMLPHMARFYGITPKILHTFRPPTARAEAMYMVHSGEPKSDQALVRVALEVYQDILKSTYAGKVLIFCITKKIGGELNFAIGGAPAEGCQYYSDLDKDPEENKRRQKSVFHWFANHNASVDGPAFLCATTCLGAGMDIPGVTAVMHVGLSDDMLDMLQTSGRGGRNGEEFLSYTIPYIKHPRIPDPDHSGTVVLRNWALSSTCRRTAITEFVDAIPDQTCSSLEGSVLCDNCRKAQGQSCLVPSHDLDDKDKPNRRVVRGVKRKEPAAAVTSG